MPRIARHAPGGIIYHVLNRASGRLKLFKKNADFEAFEQVLLLAHQRVPTRILGWCMMANHWHLVLWPEREGQLSAFVRQLTLTHAQRWKHAHNAVGEGHLYQGRFKSFPVQDNQHLLTVLRYVERNPIRAELVRKAEDWQWNSHHVRRTRQHPLMPVLGEWPIDRPAHWNQLVNASQAEADVEALRLHIARGRPYGDLPWVQKTVKKLHLETTMRPRGRQKGGKNASPPGTKPKQK